MGRPKKQPFIQVDLDLHSSRDLASLAAQLRSHLPEAARPFAIEILYAKLGKVWGGFLRNNPSGFIDETAPEIVEYWAGWAWESGAFFEAFCDIFCEPVGDRLRVRGWAKRYRAFIPEPTQAIAVQRLDRAASSAKSTSSERRSRVSVQFPPGNSTRNRTVNGTDIGAFTGTKIEEGRELLYPSPSGDGATDAFASAAAAGSPPVANRVAAGSAAALPPGTTARDGDEPDAGHDPITETGMSLADASQITVSLSDGVKTLGEISVKGLRKLLPLAGERGNAALVEAISVVLADRDQLAEAAS